MVTPWSRTSPISRQQRPLLRRQGVDDRLIDIDALALYLDLSKNTIYDWRKRGQGPAAFKLGKHLRWRLSEVDAWLED